MIARDVHPFFLAESAFPRGAGQAGEAGSLPPVRPASPLPVRYCGVDQAGNHIAFAVGSPDMERPAFDTYGLPSLKAPNGEIDYAVPMAGAVAFVKWQKELGTTHMFGESPYIPTVFPGAKVDGVMVRLLMSIAGALAMACLQEGIVWREVTPAEWRKTFGIPSPAPNLDKAARRSWLKDQAIIACNDHDWSPLDHHQAEAGGVLFWGLCRDFPDYAQRNTPLFGGAA